MVDATSYRRSRRRVGGGKATRTGSNFDVEFVHYPGGWPDTYTGYGYVNGLGNPDYSDRLDSLCGPDVMSSTNAAKLTGLGGSVRFGNINGQNMFLAELSPGQKVTVIDFAGSEKFGAYMEPSDRPTVYVKVMKFPDEPHVGVAPLFVFFFVPIVLNLLKKGYHVYVNCKRGCNRSGGGMYALCLALGIPPDVAVAHLRRIRKKTCVRDYVDVMYTEGGKSFEAQVKEMYRQRDSSGGMSRILQDLAREKYCVKPEWVETKSHEKVVKPKRSG